MEIRELRSSEHDAWLRLREQLWPDFSREQLTQEESEILTHRERYGVLVASISSGKLVGFIEVALRDWAEGCSTRPVGYIEAWYVDPKHRRKGIGRKLVLAAERWALSRGCTEMASDAELANEISQSSHEALGYTEILRVVLFSKKIK